MSEIIYRIMVKGNSIHNGNNPFGVLIPEIGSTFFYYKYLQSISAPHKIDLKLENVVYVLYDKMDTNLYCKLSEVVFMCSEY